MDAQLECNIEERLWGIGTKAQQCLAWIMFDDDADFLYKGNWRFYEDIAIVELSEQFLD